MPLNHEQKLIGYFEKLIRNDKEYGFDDDKIINFNCRSKKYADIEYETKKGYRMIIEAKTHHSPDRHNSLHKIFGELLKEANRDRKVNKVFYALLIPATNNNNINGEEFYKNKLIENVGSENLKKFSAIIPVSFVFVCKPKSLKMFTWNNFFSNQSYKYEWYFS